MPKRSRPASKQTAASSHSSHGARPSNGKRKAFAKAAPTVVADSVECGAPATEPPEPQQEEAAPLINDTAFVNALHAAAEAAAEEDAGVGYSTDDVSRFLQSLDACAAPAAE